MLLRALNQLGRYDEAVANGHRALELASQPPGEHEEEVGYTCYLLATMSARGRGPSEDASLACRAVQAVQLIAGKYRIFNAPALRHLAQLCSQFQEVDCASTAWKCCVAELERAGERGIQDRLSVLDEWAATQTRLGRLKLAASIRRQRLEVALRALSPGAPALIECLQACVLSCAAVPDGDAACSACQLVLARVAEAPGPLHAQMVATLDILASVLRTFSPGDGQAEKVEARAQAIRNGLIEQQSAS
jgi:hypothetical protein